MRKSFLRNLIKEMVTPATMKQSGVINAKGYTEYWDAIVKFLFGSSTELDRFVTHYGQSDLMKKLKDMWQKEMGTHVMCYRGFVKYEHENKPEMQKMLMKFPIRSTIEFQPAQQYQFQHWSLDKDVAYKFAQLDGSGKSLNPDSNGMVIKANVPIDQVLFSAYNFNKDNLVKPLREYYDEKELVVWHNKKIFCIVVDNSALPDNRD